MKLFYKLICSSDNRFYDQDELSSSLQTSSYLYLMHKRGIRPQSQQLQMRQVLSADACSDGSLARDSTTIQGGVLIQGCGQTVTLKDNNSSRERLHTANATFQTFVQAHDSGHELAR